METPLETLARMIGKTEEYKEAVRAIEEMPDAGCSREEFEAWAKKRNGGKQ